MWLIIDEAQILYVKQRAEEHKNFWDYLMNLHNNQAFPQHRVLLFGLFGDLHVTGTLLSSPVRLKAYGMELVELNKPEFDQMVALAEKEYETFFPGFKVDEDLKQFLQRFTSMHIGLLSTVLAVFSGKLSRFKFETTEVNAVKEKLKQEIISPRFIEILTEQSRSMPAIPHTEEHRRLLKGILLNKGPRESAPNLAGSDLTDLIFDLLRQGVIKLHTSAAGKPDSTPQQQIRDTIQSFASIQFASRAVELAAAYSIFLPPIPYTVIECPSSLLQLVERAIQLIDVVQLRETESYSVATGQPLERQWQFLLYAPLVHLLKSTSIISIDVGHSFGDNGFLDFYINSELRWGLEILREGRLLPEHYDRLNGANGRYRHIPLRDWLVVDFRSRRPLPTTLQRYPKTLFVLYDSSACFSTMTLVMHGRQEKTVSLMDAQQLLECPALSWLRPIVSK